MISILNHGNVPVLFAVCWHCGCQFTYDEEDIRKSDKGNEYIICPDCRNTIGLYSLEHNQKPSEELFDSYDKKRKVFLIDGHWKEDVE